MLNCVFTLENYLEKRVINASAKINWFSNLSLTESFLGSLFKTFFDVSVYGLSLSLSVVNFSIHP